MPKKVDPQKNTYYECVFCERKLSAATVFFVLIFFRKHVDKSPKKE